jgi:hypothetical protein
MPLLEHAFNDRLMNSCRRSRRWHPPGDVERQLWMWLESGRWQVANKGMNAECDSQNVN